jgi:hypothetical protein
MSLLPTTLAATGFAPFGRSEPRPLLEGSMGAARRAANPLTQAGQFAGQCGERLVELFALKLQALGSYFYL